MCNFDAESVPKGWQYTCSKRPDSLNCTFFCSPNGKVFTSLEAVHQHNRELERKKIEKEMKKSMRQDVINKVNVNNSTMLACNLCDGKFYNPSMLKKHQRDVHGWSNIRKESLDYQKQFSKLNFPYNSREVESHMVESVFDRNVQQGLRLVKSNNPNSIPASGISVSGLSVNNPKPDLSNVRLERNTQTPFHSEPVSKLSKLKDVSFSRKPKHHQPLGPQIMEQYMAGPNNHSTGSLQNFFSKAKDFEPKIKYDDEDGIAKIKAEYHELSQSRLHQTTLSKFQQTFPQSQQHKRIHHDPPQNLLLQSSQGQPLQLQPQHNFSQPSPYSVEPRRPIPISGEEMLQALSSRNENSQARRRDVSFPIRRGREASKSILRKVVKKVDLKPKPVRKKKVINPNYSAKHLITVSMACKFLGLKDYPVPVNEFNKQFFENREYFEAYFLPLVASVNQGAHPLSIKTLVKAKWLEVLKAKPGEFRSLYFNKPRRNKVKVNVVS